MSTLDYILKKYNIDSTTGVKFELPGGRGRGGLTSLWQELGYKKGAEIGVESGRYSVTICATNPGVKLYLVDPWKTYPQYREHVTQEHLDILYNDTIKRARPYNCEVLRGFSMDVVKKFDDNSLDFVYIDANHDFQNVTDDITQWSKKVRKEGVVSGHDFRQPRVGAVNDTVDAVNAYVKANNINPLFIWYGDESPSFMWIKS